MFWTFMLLVGLAVVFIKFGMMMVMVSVLAGGLQLALLVIVGAFIVHLWRKAKTRRAQ